MEGSYSIFFYLLLNVFHLLGPAFSLPLCTNFAPLPYNDLLKFCPYNGTSCCNFADDWRIQKQFQLMKISDSACAALVKSLLYAECDKFSAELYRVSFVPPQKLHVLCNSTISIHFCSKLWRTCQDASIANSPFDASLKGQALAPAKSRITKLVDLWHSEEDFCHVFGGSSVDGSLCFGSEPITLKSVVLPFLFLKPARQIWLGIIPEVGTGGLLELDESSPFVDISDEVHFDTQFGLMRIAFHPKFTQNGRFFASFICDKQQWPGCAGRCACNSDVKCDPSKLPPDSGAQPFQYQVVVAEFTANAIASRPQVST